jgi:hypothetical protein
VSLPEAARRLFPNQLSDRLSTDRFESTILERLLEDGDRDDLRWLTSEIPEERLIGWLRERGDRQLSDRSRAFWSLLLGVPAPTRRARGNELWPL